MSIVAIYKLFRLPSTTHLDIVRRRLAVAPAALHLAFPGYIYPTQRLPAQYEAGERDIQGRFPTLWEAFGGMQSNWPSVRIHAHLPTSLCCEPLVGTSFPGPFW